MYPRLTTSFAKAMFAMAPIAAPAAAQFGQGGSVGTMMGGAASSGSGEYRKHKTPEDRKRLEEQDDLFFRL